MYNLTGKVALITGAGRRSGIGAAIALRLAQEGAHVAVSDSCASPSDLPHGGNAQWEELVGVAEAVAAIGVQSLPIQADITKSDEVQAMMAAVQTQFGRLDILVNNAGATVGPAPVLHMTEEAWRKTLDINATGTFLCCKYALPLLLAGQRGGRIINISSIAAVSPRPFMAAYAGSKAAINALTQSLAQEVGDYGITVNAILPGDIDTAMKQWGMQLEALVMGQTPESVAAALAARIPLRRLGLPADVAQLAAFLASAEAAFITGQTYNLTGGRELT